MAKTLQYDVLYKGSSAGERSTLAGAEALAKRIVAMGKGKVSMSDIEIKNNKSPSLQINANHRDVKKAAKLYEEFREAKPKRGRVVEMELPKTLMIMGNLQFVGYDTTRRGKTELYKHDFAPGSRPLICADPKSGQLFLIGGRYHVTERGIVDIDARGKEIDD